MSDTHAKTLLANLKLFLRQQTTQHIVQHLDVLLASAEKKLLSPSMIELVLQAVLPVCEHLIANRYLQQAYAIQERAMQLAEQYQALELQSALYDAHGKLLQMHLQDLCHTAGTKRNPASL